MLVDTSVMRGRPEAGFLTKDVTGSVLVTLTTEEIKAKYIIFTGAMGAAFGVAFPLTADSAGLDYFITNNTTGAFALTIRGIAAVAPLAITQGSSGLVIWNGANFVPMAAQL